MIECPHCRRQVGCLIQLPDMAEPRCTFCATAPVSLYLPKGSIA